MSSCLEWMIGRAARGVCSGVSLNSRQPYLLLSCTNRQNSTFSWRWVQFTTFATTVDPTDEKGEENVSKKKKVDPRARVTIGSVGRKIQQRHLQVISETGENLGTMHRADVLRMMDERRLKLVPLNENKDPPVYRLMSGKQIHEEQMKLRDKQKSKGGPVQVKELSFSSDIASRDLGTKLKQVESWLEKNHHVRITVKSGHVERPQQLDKALEEMVEQMDVKVGYVSQPKLIKEGRSAMCIIRPPSAKELAQKKKTTTAQSAPTPSPALSPDPPTESAENSVN